MNIINLFWMKRIMIILLLKEGRVVGVCAGEGARSVVSRVFNELRVGWGPGVARFVQVVKSVDGKSFRSGLSLANGRAAPYDTNKHQKENLLANKS